MGLTKIAITRPIFMLMLMVGAIFFGWNAYKTMPLEENPEVQFGVITVTAVYPGAGPDEVSTLVSKRIEESISGVNGLLELTSSSQEGVGVVVANFEVGTNMDSALNDVRAKVDTVLSDLPKEVLKPTIDKIDGASEPILNMSLSSDKLNNQELRDLADDKIKDRFARIKGVAQVSVTGGEEREIQVRLKKDRLMSLGIGAAQVQGAIAATSLNVPSGRIIAKDMEYGIRVLGEYKSVDQIRQTVIRISDPQDPNRAASIKLSDIAEVVDVQKDRRDIARVDGKEAVVMTVQKAKEGNAVEIAKGAKAVYAEIERDFGVKTSVTQDKSIVVEESLFDLTFALIFGIVLVTVIVFMFLHDWRGTLIVFLTIPICLLATLMVLKALGFTLNNMSLLALSLAIGVLVDDAIVVLENIYRHLKMGEDPKTAALNGRGEIGLAAIAITFADIVVFLPMAFMGGVVGQFFRPLGIGFAVCVFLSLMVSFTITPMLAARWYKEGEDVEAPKGRFAQWFDRSFHGFEGRYGRVLEWALQHRWFVFVTGFIFLLGVGTFIAGSFFPSAGAAFANGAQLMVPMIAMITVIALVANAITKRVFRWQLLTGALACILVLGVFGAAGFGYRQWKGADIFSFTFSPPSDQGEVVIRIEGPPSATLQDTLAITERLEKIAKGHPDAKYVLTQVGNWSGAFAGAGGSRGVNLAQITVELHEKEAILDRLQPWVKHDHPLRKKSDTSVASDLIQSVGKVPGAKVTITTQGSFGFGSAIQMSFASDDREKLIATVEKIRSRLAAGEIEGVINVDTSSKPGKPEFRAIPMPDRMADADVTTADVASTLRLLYEGNDDVKLRVSGREYPIRVLMDPEDRNNADLIQDVPIKFSQGQPVFLPQVAKIEEGVTIDKVNRRNRIEEIQITSDLLAGYASGTVQGNIDAWLKKENLVPEGVVIKPLGQADVQARETGYLMGTLLIGLILVYMLLASLYDNLLYPFIIQLAQPQAFVGALLALILTDKTLNIVGFIGLIALVGLVGKNAILLVDYTNTLRGRGMDRHDALVKAGPVRLRPIMMTTIAVVVGTLPTALAIGRGSEFRETLGIIIIGGIALSTILTLVVIPCSYTIFDDLSDSITRWTGKQPKPSELFKKKEEVEESSGVR
jgi:HAE1 family hydrophobic/amphiphilic exporter-1